jgi:hypothetical protein
MVLPLHSDSDAATVKTLHHQVASLKTSLDQRDDTISTQETTISTQEQEITTLQVENEHLSSRNQWLERQMKLSQIHRFGSRSEKAHSLQRELFNEAEMIVDRTDADQTDPDPADDTTTVPAHQRKKRSRTPTLSDDLAKEVVLYGPVSGLTRDALSVVTASCGGYWFCHHSRQNPDREPIDRWRRSDCGCSFDRTFWCKNNG